MTSRVTPSTLFCASISSSIFSISSLAITFSSAVYSIVSTSCLISFSASYSSACRSCVSLITSRTISMKDSRVTSDPQMSPCSASSFSMSRLCCGPIFRAISNMSTGLWREPGNANASPSSSTTSPFRASMSLGSNSCIGSSGIMMVRHVSSSLSSSGASRRSISAASRFQMFCSPVTIRISDSSCALREMRRSSSVSNFSSIR
mmetsp:Transcript_35251/g.62867  ORF Transcript_35251/g.62867 Transcript_35251/m.62867 type:complete len:204 (+) Transcript_35251:1-612(+)